MYERKKEGFLGSNLNKDNLQCLLWYSSYEVESNQRFLIFLHHREKGKKQAIFVYKIFTCLKKTSVTSFNLYRTCRMPNSSIFSWWSTLSCSSFGEKRILRSFCTAFTAPSSSLSHGNNFRNMRLVDIRTSKNLWICNSEMNLRIWKLVIFEFLKMLTYLR